MRKAFGLALCAAGGMAEPALAQAWTVGGNVTLRGGYQTNPYMRNDTTKGAATGGVSAVATATREAARSTTTLMGSADYAAYTSSFGDNSNFLASLSRSQRLSERVGLQGNIAYTNTLNPQSNFGFAPNTDTSAGFDYLTVGTRTQRIDGSLNADWQPTQYDTFRIGGTASYSRFSNGRAARGYDQEGGNFTYQRTINDKTSVGFTVTASTFHQANQPTGETYQATLNLTREINAHWSFDGGVGAVRQKGSSNAGTVSTETRTSLAFNGSLCGTYPRLNVCLTGSRTSAPSGIGGLRTDTRFGLNGSYQLTERSSVSGSATYDNSSGGGSLVARQRFYDLSVSYNRTISRRFSVGGTGRYQRRETSNSPLFLGGSPTGYSATANIVYNWGRNG